MLACVQTLPPLKRKSRRGGVCTQAKACWLNKLFGVHVYHFLFFVFFGGGGREGSKMVEWKFCYFASRVRDLNRSLTKHGPQSKDSNLALNPAKTNCMLFPTQQVCKPATSWPTAHFTSLPQVNLWSVLAQQVARGAYQQ